MRISLLIVVFLVIETFGRKGFGPTEQEWGFVTVRKGAHMFWWLHQTSAPVDHYTERPLVIWLQGGPGSSSTGYGNFAELGPYDENLNERNTTWLKDVNVLFVDNPVGTGFSYVESSNELTTTNRQIADDFLVLMQGFYTSNPEYSQTPLYIFAESYGGKMAVEIAIVLHKAIEDGTLEANLVGVALGDSWISPIDSVLSWAPYLLHAGAIDSRGYEKVLDGALRTKAAVDAGKFEEATEMWSHTERIISYVTGGIDFYNILTKTHVGNYNFKSAEINSRSSLEDVDETIKIIMNNQVKKALDLKVNFTWQSASPAVFDKLSGDFMKPVTHLVEVLLNTTDIKVAVFNGQLDLIVDTPGTIAWVDRLKFDGSSDWEKAVRNPLVVNNVIEGYVKKVGNLGMYWINRAGHMVPSDNPEAMNYILKDISNDFGVNKVKHNVGQKLL